MSRSCKVRFLFLWVVGAFADEAEFVDRIIASHISDSTTKSSDSESHRYNFISALLASETDHAPIRAELLNILLAGRDTVASLLSNILWELPRHPTILSTLRSELNSTCGTDQPSYTDLKNMKYLRAIVNESQRLYPIVPINSREARDDTILPRGGGEDEMSPVLVPKGSYVAWQMHSMQRREDLFGEDAGMFRPERWLEDGFRPGWAFVPFSGGPRVCIGQVSASYWNFGVEMMLMETELCVDGDDVCCCEGGAGV